jgi:predicted outer membrane lipoprotein
MRRAQIVSFAAVPLTWLNIVRCASRGILNAVWHEHQLADESIAD